MALKISADGVAALLIRDPCRSSLRLVSENFQCHCEGGEFEDVLSAQS